MLSVPPEAMLPVADSPCSRCAVMPTTSRSNWARLGNSVGSNVFVEKNSRYASFATSRTSSPAGYWAPATIRSTGRTSSACANRNRRRSSPRATPCSGRLTISLLQPQTRVDCIAQPVTDKVDAQHRQGNKCTRGHPQPRHFLQHGCRLGRVDHVSPARRWRLHAKPEERETCLGQNRRRDSKRCRDGDRRQCVEQDRVEDHSPVARSNRPRRQDEI